MKLPKTYEIMCKGRQVGTIQHRFDDWWFFYGEGYNTLPHSYPLDEAKREAKKHFSKAFTLIEVLVWIAIMAVLGLLLFKAIQETARAIKRNTKAEEPAKPFERFTVTYQRTPAGNPDLWLFHDNIDGSDVLYISRRSGDGTAVVLPKPLRFESGYGLTVTNVRPWTERP